MANNYRSLLLLLLLAILLVAGVYLLRTASLRRSTQAAGTTNLLLTAPTTVALGSQVIVHVNLTNPSSASIVGTDLVISYNPAILDPVTVSPNSNLTLRTVAPLVSSSGAFNLAQAKTGPGVLEFGVVAYDWPSQSYTSPLSATSADLATITFNAISAGTTTVGITKSVNPDTKDSNVTDASNPPQDVLASATGTSITVSTTDPTPTPFDFAFNYQVHFQGTASSIPQGTIRQVTLTFKQGAATVYTTTQTLTLTPTGVSGQISATGLPAGTYDVFITAPGFLTKKFTQVVVTSGTQSHDFVTALRAGDLVGNDNTLNATDVTDMVNHYTTLRTSPANSIYDIDGDGKITLTDVSLVLVNFTTNTVTGDF